MKDTKYTFEWLEAVNQMSNEKRKEFLSGLLGTLQLMNGVGDVDGILKRMVDRLKS